MITEQVSTVLIADDCLHLVLKGRGKPAYQYIYREAISVYWDPARGSFKSSTLLPGLPLDQLILHMVQVIKDYGVEIELSASVAFVGISANTEKLLKNELRSINFNLK